MHEKKFYLFAIIYSIAFCWLLNACTPGVKASPRESLLSMNWEYRNFPDEVESLLNLADILYSESGPLENNTRSLHAACKAVDIDPNNARAQHMASRACAWITDFGEMPFCYDMKELENRILSCTDFGEAAVKLDPDNAEYYLYYSLNMAMKIQKINFARQAFNIIPLMKALKKTIKLDESLHEGEPLRVLAAIYLKAPPWPAGPGDEEKALELLEKAVEKYPGHPLNHMFYAEALMEVEEYELAVEEIKVARNMVDPIKYSWRSEKYLKMIDKLEKKIQKEAE